MPRKLKTYITSVGFFDLAVAAPTMKAALEAWGSANNLFQRGLADETDDPAIVAATIAQPGVVLRRGVGTDNPYEVNGALPKSIPAHAKASSPTAKPRVSANLKSKAQQKRNPKKASSEKQQKAEIIEFEKEKARREKERAKEKAERKKQKEEDAHDEERRQKAVAKAKAIRDRARERHEAKMKTLEKELEVAES